MRWLDGITNSMDMTLSKLQGFVVVGGEMSPIAAAAFGFYCWAYLILLRRWQNDRVRRLATYWFGALLPLAIVLVSFSMMQRSFW